MSVRELIVVKIGGGAGIDPLAACADIVERVRGGSDLIVVHGGSERADRLARELGHEPRRLISPSGHASRYTDPVMRDIFVRAATELNKEIAALLKEEAIETASLTGEGCPLEGVRKLSLRAVENGRVRVVRDDYSGTITGVAADRLMKLLRAGLVPVVPPLAYSMDDGLLNVDGDRAAAAIAAAVRASRLVILSNVPGLMERFPDETSLIPRVEGRDLALALEWAQGRMKRKILSVQAALEGGVPQVVVADGRKPHPLRQALAGGGTWFG